MHFSDQLMSAVQEKRSVLCIGLDPHFSEIPLFLREKYEPTEAIERFLYEILEAVSEHTAVVKPNTAFFEQWGSRGWRVLENIAQRAKTKGLLVIADAKRGDIGSTAKAYAEAFLSKETPFDALTISPYLGQDGILPFLEKAKAENKGLFVLVRTSNESAGEFQDLPVGDALLHEEVARSVARLGSEDRGENGFSRLGAVVGASIAEEIAHLRQEMPAQIFLVPGYGAQGESAKDVQGAFFPQMRGAIINSSRGIVFAGREKDFAERSAQAAKYAKEDLWNTIV